MNMTAVALLKTIRGSERLLVRIKAMALGFCSSFFVEVDPLGIRVKVTGMYPIC